VVTLHFRAEGDPDLLAELEKEAELRGLAPTRPARMRTVPLPLEVIVALGSAGVFTAIFQTLSSVLLRNKDRELTVTIPSQGKAITLKGHDLHEEKELLRLLALDLGAPGAHAERATGEVKE
jgi:hypothetical protein